MTALWRIAGGGATLLARVTANARSDRIDGIWRGPSEALRLAVRVTAPPERGRANAAVCALLAEALGCAPSHVTVVAGEGERLKTLFIAGDPNVVAARLAGLVTQFEGAQQQ